MPQIRAVITEDKIIGAVLGLVVCAVVITGNVRRADPHLVSVYPDVLSVAIAPFAVFGLSRRRRQNGESSDVIQRFGVRVGATAGAVFAVGLGVFSMYWLSAPPLWVFGTTVAFSSIFGLSCFSAYLAGHKRVTAV